MHAGTTRVGCRRLAPRGRRHGPPRDILDAENSRFSEVRTVGWSVRVRGARATVPLLGDGEGSLGHQSPRPRRQPDESAEAPIVPVVIGVYLRGPGTRRPSPDVSCGRD